MLVVQTRPVQDSVAMPKHANVDALCELAVKQAKVVVLAVMVGAAAPTLPQTPTGLFAALIAEARCPVSVEMDTPFPRQPSCSDAAQPDWLRSVESGHYDGRAGSLVLAAQIASCNGRSTSELLAAYEATQSDAGSLAVVSLAAGAVTTDEYDGLVSEWLSRLAAASSKQLDPYTAISFLQFAAGRCLNALTDECLSRTALRLLPADWSLAPDAGLAVGDLFGRPLALTDSGTAVITLRRVLDLGFPVRLDVLMETKSVWARQACEKARRAFLSRLFGPDKEL